MSDQSTDTPDCDRCDGDFRVKVCEVHPQTEERDRVEAHLCYECRQEVTHRVLGGVLGS